MQKYLIVVWHDVEASIEGPFPNEEARLDRAREIRQGSDEHGLYALDTEGTATISNFGGDDLDY